MPVMTVADSEAARGSVFFGSLPRSVFDEIAEQSRIIDLNVGQVLFREGDPANAIFAVLEGLVKLSVTKRGGGDVVVETFHAGTSFAEALAFSESRYPVTASSLVKSRILMAPSEVLQASLRGNPDAFGATIAATYAHLHRLVRQIEALKSASGLERLVRYILALSADQGGAAQIEIPYEKQVLASLLGIKPETLSRGFRKLRDHGVVLEGRVLRLEDPAALRAMLSGD